MSAPFETVRLTPVIGAEVRGLDVTGGIDEATTDALYRTLLEHHVLILRGRSLLPEQLEVLASAFGPLAPAHHTYPQLPGHPSVTVLDNGPDNPPDNAEWHTDLSFRPGQPFLSILQPSLLPPVGGDTLFASLFAVHDALLPGMRADLGDLSSVHDMGSFRTRTFQEGGVALMNERMAEVGSAVHPMIDHHPASGRPFVRVNECFTTHVLGMPMPEGRRLLAFLFDMINRPQFQVRVRWEKDMVLLWDNRGTQHYAADDYLPHRRVMHRVMVAEDCRANGTADWHPSGGH